MGTVHGWIGSFWSSHLASQKMSLGCKKEQTATAVVCAPLQSLTIDAVGIEATSPPWGGEASE